MDKAASRIRLQSVLYFKNDANIVQAVKKCYKSKIDSGELHERFYCFFTCQLPFNFSF